MRLSLQQPRARVQGLLAWRIPDYIRVRGASTDPPRTLGRGGLPTAHVELSQEICGRLWRSMACGEVSKPHSCIVILIL